MIVLYLAVAAALLSAPHVQLGRTALWIPAAFPLLVLAMLVGRRSPDDRLSGSLLDSAASAIGAVSLAGMTMVVLESVIDGLHPVTLSLRLWVFAAVSLALVRTLLLVLHRRARRKGTLSKPTLIVGAGVVGEYLVRWLLAERQYGLRPVGFIDSDPLPRPEMSGSRPVAILGGPDDLAEAIERTGAKHVIMAFSAEPDDVLVEKVRQCEKLGVDVSLVPRLYELADERASLEHIGGLPLLTLHAADQRDWRSATKHVLDGGAALLSVLAPVTQHDPDPDPDRSGSPASVLSPSARSDTTTASSVAASSERCARLKHPRAVAAVYPPPD